MRTWLAYRAEAEAEAEAEADAAVLCVSAKLSLRPADANVICDKVGMEQDDSDKSSCVRREAGESHLPAAAAAAFAFARYGADCEVAISGG